MSAATTTAPTGAPKRDLATIRAAGKQVAKQAGGSTVQAFFESNKPTLQALLPRHMTPDRMLKIALSALRTTPKLMECTIESLFGSIVHCAQLGLEPNTPQGHIYLIPFGNSRKGSTEVQVIVGYKGLIDLARRSGQIVSISARVRYANDPWKLSFGTDDYIEHAPAEDGDRGEPVGVYAVARLKDGGVQFEYLTLSEVNRIRDGSQGFKAAIETGRRYNKPAKHPWIDHWEEMARKTAIRRLCKYLPMSIELASAVALEDHGDSGRPQNMAAVLDGVEYTVAGDDAPPMDEDDAADQAQPQDAGQDDQPQGAAQQDNQQDNQQAPQRGPSSQRREAEPERAPARQARQQPQEAREAPPLPLRGGGQSHAASTDAGQSHAIHTNPGQSHDYPPNGGGGQSHALPEDDGGFGGME